MRRYLPHIFTAALILTVVALPTPAHAIWGVDDVVGAVVSPLVLLILKFTAFLSALGGVFLNSIVYYTVLQMADNFTRFPAIDEAWRVIRDIANMGFIFVLLYAAIQKILGIGKGTNQLIVKMIVAAILVNFSLFFTKAIIDIANLLALFFYELIAPGAAVANPDFFQTGISNAFVEPMGIQTLWKMSGDFGNFAVMGIMGAIVQLIAAFIFFAIAIMFIVRYVVLVFVLILSPIMFLSMVLPGLNDSAKKWWNALLGQSFFAPVYFLLAWVTVFMINRLVNGMLAARDWSLIQSGVQTANGMDSISYSQGLAQTFISFAVIIAFMIASLLIAKGWADKAGSGVTSMTKWAMGAAGGASMGLAGFAGRRTLGRAGQVLADNETLKEAAAKRTGMAGAAARLTLAAGRKTAGSTFDARGSTIYEKLSDQTKVSFGKASGKGGFEQIVKDKVKKEEELAKTFKPSDIVVNNAERELDAAKKSGDAARIKTAQEAVDNLKGVNDEEARNRRMRELIIGGMSKKEAKEHLNDAETQRLRKVEEYKKTGLTEKEAEDKWKDEVKKAVDAGISAGKTEAEAREEVEKTLGWKADSKKSAGNDRQEAYAKNLEEAKFMGMGNQYAGFDKNRVAFVGPVTREARLSAMEIRKKLKEKKPADKLAEELSKASEAADSSTVTPTPTPTGTTGAPTGSTTTPPPSPGPSPATP